MRASCKDSHSRSKYSTSVTINLILGVAAFSETGFAGQQLVKSRVQRTNATMFNVVGLDIVTSPSGRWVFFVLFGMFRLGCGGVVSFFAARL